MKTFLIWFIAATILAPISVMAQETEPPPEPPKCDGEKKGKRVPPILEGWKAADSNNDGLLSSEEFYAMPRIKNLAEDKQKNLFKRLDKDADGKLSRHEIWRMIKQHNPEGKPMQRLWELDSDKSGGVSIDEFKTSKLHSKLPVEKQEELFRKLDTNQDGQISPQDRPAHPPHRDGEKPPCQGGPNGERPHMDPHKRVRQLDKDHDGALSFEEFRANPMKKNLSEEQQKNRFQSMDKNHDQKITPDELPEPPEPPAN